MNNPKIKPCNKICKECGFSKNGAKDTLYYEAMGMMNQGILFPCHMELKAVSGSENQGVEMMDEVRVCRGYVAYMKKHRGGYWQSHYIWRDLMADIRDKELEDIYTEEELKANHVGIREFIRLGNNGENW